MVEVGPGRRGHDVGVGDRAARASTRSTDPFAWALIKPDGADTPMLHAVDAGSARRHVAPACGSCPRWRATSARATSTTSRASCPDGEAMTPDAPTITLPDVAAGRRARASVRTPAALDYTFTAGQAPVPLPPGHRPRRRSSASRPAGRQGLRAAPRRRPRARRADDRTGRARPHRHGHLVLRRERAVLRPGDGGALHERPDPARRRRPADHAPHPGGRRPTRSASACGSRPCGSTTTELGPDAREHQVVPAHRRARRRRPHAGRGRRHRPRLVARARRDRRTA